MLQQMALGHNLGDTWTDATTPETAAKARLIPRSILRQNKTYFGFLASMHDWLCRATRRETDGMRCSGWPLHVIVLRGSLERDRGVALAVPSF